MTWEEYKEYCSYYGMEPRRDQFNRMKKWDEITKSGKSEILIKGRGSYPPIFPRKTKS